MCACASFPCGAVSSRHAATCRGATCRGATWRHAAPRAGLMVRCCALALLCAALAAQAHGDKRADISPVPFVMGSRYGRSPERVMAPRNDRFFMGSRYGKRSEPPLAGAAGAAACGAGGAPCALLCRYTGVMALYKCVPPHRQLQFVRRSSEELSRGGEP